MICSYVYKLVNRITNEYYFGYRYKNVILGLRPEDDLGITYFTSSKYVRPRFDDFDIEILALFFEKTSAYDYEQELISVSIKDELCLNRHYQKNDGSKKFIHDINHSEKSKDKMRGPRGKYKKYNRVKPSWNKGLTKENDDRVKSLAENRKKAGNDHQIGQKYSPEHCENISKSLTGTEMSDESRKAMSTTRAGKSWEELYGIEGAKKRRASRPKGYIKQRTIAVSTPEGKFNSIIDASKHHQVSEYTIKTRCKNARPEWADWYYL